MIELHEACVVVPCIRHCYSWYHTHFVRVNILCLSIVYLVCMCAEHMYPYCEADRHVIGFCYVFCRRSYLCPFGVCAMLSKEQGIMVIAVCLTYDLFIAQKVAKSLMQLQYNIIILL